MFQRFLEEEEIDRIGYKGLLKGQKAYVEFDKVNVTWEGEIPKPILHDISFKADQDNNVVIIHGPVGAGKTTLLMTIMNEVSVSSGSVKIEGKVAYTAQQPWIFSGTIKQNILFGQEYNENYFNMVLEACALLADLDLFDKREYTLVGEKGVSLSGGQKARISLARAVYSNADIYLLDDPLSAVDTRVGKYIFERCIKDLLKEKVVFLVTHQTQYLCEATHTIHLTTDSMLPFDTETDLTENSNENVEYRENNVPNDEISLAEKDTSKDITEKINENSIPEEHRKRGKVSYNVYTSYFRKGIGTISIIALCILLIFSQAFLTFTDYWIGEWAKYEEDRRSKNSTDTQFVFNDNQDNNIYLFATLAVVSFILTVLSIGLFNSALIKCSWELHDRMFHRVLKAPMFFFDTNPIGQILNRFSGDIHVLDEELPEPFSEFVLIALLCMAGLILSCTSVPYLAVAAIIVTIVFIFFRNFYMCTARQIKRIEATDRSPTFTHLSATLSGISSIRSLSMEREIHREFVRCLDYQAESRIMFYRCSRWFSQRLDGGFIIFVIICMFASVAVAVHTETDVGLIGVTFTYLISLCGMFQYGVRQSTEVDNLMTSAERVGEYTKLEIEEESSELVEVDKEWVKDGSINFDNVCYAYHKSLPYVLHDLSFRINPTEKIGIVGRTGAGKSSLISLIFRLGVSEGSIEIDGYDISRLTLKTLRQAISVIPQDPVLFCGSLRTNMDPFKEYADEEIWDALEKVEMKVSVEKFNRGLETEIAESGGNLSVGEKQLICLARALLKQNKILLIDEATANIDYRTDTLIQTTIRTSFKDCTVLTIAHRLNTIMDSDRIMVIHQGRIVEFDQPSVLLQLENGYLRKMVDETGRKCVELLDNLAHGRR